MFYVLLLVEGCGRLRVFSSTATAKVQPALCDATNLATAIISCGAAVTTKLSEMHTFLMPTSVDFQSALQDRGCGTVHWLGGRVFLLPHVMHRVGDTSSMGTRRGSRV